VDPWCLDDPTQPKPAEIIAALIEFRDAMMAEFARIHAHLSEHDRRFDEIDRHLNRIDRRLMRMVR